MPVFYFGRRWLSAIKEIECDLESARHGAVAEGLATYRENEGRNLVYSCEAIIARYRCPALNFGANKVNGNECTNPNYQAVLKSGARNFICILNESRKNLSNAFACIKKMITIIFILMSHNK